MRTWTLDEACAAEYDNPGDRRFHAQPTACQRCGPGYELRSTHERLIGSDASIRRAAELLAAGRILAVKGLGGYHLACDAANKGSVAALRGRKYRKEKPFALMVRNLQVARSLVHLSDESETLLLSTARPIVLAPTSQSIDLAGVAPGCDELGLMLPYTPLHHLLFAGGAPDILVFTSANRSSEPIAYEDEDAWDRLQGLADAFLVGERPIARRVDDSVVRVGACGPVILRRARGYAPAAVAAIPIDRPVLAVGGDLKNTITLVIEGQAFVSQHIGDLEHAQSLRAFRETIDDLTSMYEMDWDDVLDRSRRPSRVLVHAGRALPSRATLRVRSSIIAHTSHLSSPSAAHVTSAFSASRSMGLDTETMGRFGEASCLRAAFAMASSGLPICEGRCFQAEMPLQRIRFKRRRASSRTWTDYPTCVPIPSASQGGISMRCSWWSAECGRLRRHRWAGCSTPQRRWWALRAR